MSYHEIVANATTISPIVDHALHYASLGWHVFPAPPGTKSGYSDLGEKHTGRKWGASKDADQIRDMFTRHPEANIGVVCGAVSGFWAVDIDTQDGHASDGFASLAALEKKHGPLPDTLQAESPSGSIHYLFKCPAGIKIRNSAGRIAPGIDVRGDGGMVIAPPSVKSGRGVYKWRSAAPIADAPAWLLARVTSAQKTDAIKIGTAKEAPAGLRPQDGTQAAKTLQAACANIIAEEPGTRNETLNREAYFVGRYVGNGEIGLDIAVHDLTAACEEYDNQSKCVSTIKGGLSAGAKKPAVTAAEMFGSVAPTIADEVPLAPTPPANLPTAPLQPTQNAATLLTRDFAPVRYVIPGYIAEGCSILAGKPKIGKSWFVLDAALAVAGGNGGRVFGRQAEQGNVLYLALEDNERRLKSRIRKVLGPFEAGQDRFEYRTEWPRADEGGLDAIEAWIKSVPKATLIIVDVLARFRPMATGRNTAAYDADYAAISGLQGLASKYDVAIVVVHHLRKNAADNDPFDKVSGTLGLSGAADSILILDRDGQGVTLYGRGRDIEEIETAVQFEKGRCRWTALGKAHEVRISDERKTIVDILKGSSEAMSPADIAAETGMRSGNVRRLITKMHRAGEVMKPEAGKYLLDLHTPVTPVTPVTPSQTVTVVTPSQHIVSPPPPY